jgi:hypothetical protein
MRVIVFMRPRTATCGCASLIPQVNLRKYFEQVFSETNLEMPVPTHSDASNMIDENHCVKMVYVSRMVFTPVAPSPSIDP